MNKTSEFLFTPWLRQDKWNGKDAVMILADAIPDFSNLNERNDLYCGITITTFKSIERSEGDDDNSDEEIPDEHHEWYRITAITRQMVQLLVASNHQKLRTLEKSPEDWIKWAVSKNFEIPWLSWAFEKGFFRDLKLQFSSDQHLSERYLNTNENKQLTFPWGTHNTKYLAVLSEAAIKFWNIDDPTDPSKAPTNEEVKNWLIKQNIPKSIAEAMATILRADGLRTGKRP